MGMRISSSEHEDFKPKNLDVIRADILSALQAVAERHGVTFALGNLTYSPRVLQRPAGGEETR